MQGGFGRAAMNGNTAELFTLLREEPDPTFQRECGNRALITAAWKGHADLVWALCQWGANVDYQVTGKTALMVAAQWGHTEVVSNLLKFGANMKITDKRGLTAADYARIGKHDAVVCLLLHEPLVEK